MPLIRFLFNKYHVRPYPYLICLLFPAVAFCQDDRVLTNAELNIQKLFIEANQEKLLGEYKEAASLYQEVLELDSENDAAQYELARVYESMDQYDKALEHIERAIRSNPDIEWYHVMKGDILEGMEEYPAAVAVYDRLINLSPGKSYYYEHLVGLLMRINQPGRALEILDRQEKVVGIVEDLIYEKVDILNSLNRSGQGVPELQKLVDLYPRNIEYLHRIATQCKLAGDEASAQKYYTRILAIDPFDARANLGLAAGYKASGDDITYLKSITSLMQNPAVQIDAKILELIPYVQKYSADPSVAFGGELGDILKGIAAQYPNEAKAHAIYADYLFSGGDYQNARVQYERTLSLDKSVFTVWEQLMYLKLAQNDMDGVLKTADQALDVFPNQGSIYYLQGVALAAKHDYNAAATSLQQGLIMTGRNTELQFKILSLLGSVYQDTGHPDKAYDALAKALKLKPDDVPVLNKYAYALAVNNTNLDQAKTMATRALQLSPTNSETEHTLAWIAFRNGDLKSAREYIEKCMDHGGGDHYKALEHYGDILISMGDADAAVEYWQLSQNAGNPSEILKRKITERRIIH